MRVYLVLTGKFLITFAVVIVLAGIVTSCAKSQGDHEQEERQGE